MAARHDSDSESTPASSPPPPLARRKHFEDEEDDSDVLESWDAAEDSEEEAEKAKKAAEAKARAEAEAAKNKKSKSQRIEEQREARRRAREEEGDDEDDDQEDSSEDEAERRARLRKTEQAADLRHAEDLFGGVVGLKDRQSTATVVSADPSDPTKTINLGSLALFNPNTKDQFARLRDTLVPLVAENSKKAQYGLFVQEFIKQIVKDLSSDQVKKIASALSTLSNEKLKEEKAAEKGGKKTKAAKTKASLTASRNISNRADTTHYEEGGLEDDDFM